MSIAAAVGFWLLHPGIAALGAAAAALPIVLHFWNQRRPRQLPWAAMEFLRRAYRRTSRRLRIEQLLLLAVRTAIIALAAMGLSRPLTGAWRQSGQAENRILVVDNSRSMLQTLPSRATALDRARQVAKEVVLASEADTRFAVITMAEPAELVSGPSLRRSEALEVIDRIKATSRRADPQAALALAAKAAQEWKSSPQSCELLVLSAATASAWTRAETSHEAVATTDLLAKHAQLTFARVNSPAAGNVGITGFKPLDRVITAHWPASFELRIENHSAAPISDLSIEVMVSRKLAQTLRIERAEPGETVTRIFEQKFPAAGQYLVEAQLGTSPGDVLAEDDRRPLAIEVVDAIKVLLVRGGRQDQAAGSDYIAAALGIAGPQLAQQSEGLFSGRTIAAAELPNEPLSGCEVIILEDVPALPPQEWRRLREFVSSGGGLLIFAGPHVEPEHYSQFTLAGQGPVPAGLAAGPSGATAGFAPPSSRHAAMAELSGNPDTGFYQAKVSKYLRASETDPRLVVVLRYTSGDPAVVEHAVGAGRVVMCTTSADMSWTNLPALGDFVSLLAGLVQHLAADRNGWRQAAAGAAIRIPLNPQETRSEVVLTGPHDGPTLMEVRPVAKGGAAANALPGWEAIDTDAARQGFYEVHVRATGRHVITAKSGDAAESNLAVLSEAELRRRLPLPFTLVDATEQALPKRVVRTGREVGHPLLLAAGLLLLVETWLAAKIDQQRSATPVGSSVRTAPLVAAGGAG